MGRQPLGACNLVSMQDVYGAFVGSFGLNVRMMREMCQVRTVEITPKPGTLLHLPATPDATFRLPLDYVIAPFVIVTHCWDAETVKLASDIVRGRPGGATLVDIGANSGLFTRQMLGSCPEFRHAFAYEPHPENFKCLQHNVASFDHVRARNYALGPNADTLDFHIDPDNCGNYSLNSSAMPKGQDCTTISVAVKSAASETRDWLATGLPIFYKSDTQGHDELIATSVKPPSGTRFLPASSSCGASRRRPGRPAACRSCWTNSRTSVSCVIQGLRSAPPTSWATSPGTTAHRTMCCSGSR